MKREQTFTEQERIAMFRVLDSVIEKINYDTELQSYVDDGDIVISISREDFKALKRAYKKLLL